MQIIQPYSVSRKKRHCFGVQQRAVVSACCALLSCHCTPFTVALLSVVCIWRIKYIHTYIHTYNVHVHQPILIIFSRNVAKKASIKWFFIFPTSPNLLLHYLGKQKAKIASFYLNTESCFASRYKKHIHIITWSQLNRYLFSQKSVVCTK